jgi:transcriptional regulator with XRE-family HTH domain
MFGDIEYALRDNLRDREYAQEYAAAFLNAYIATQIKVIREQRKMTQADLGRETGTTQAGISRYEDVNYSSWSLRTLQKLAHAFDVRLRVSFEPYGTLPDEVTRFDRSRLQVVERIKDPALHGSPAIVACEGDGFVDIGAYKALAGTFKNSPADTQPNQHNESRAHGTDNGLTGENTSNVGVGRIDERRENPDVGLRSAIGGTL